MTGRPKNLYEGQGRAKRSRNTSSMRSELRLWKAVVLQAVQDYVYSGSQDAHDWLFSPKPHQAVDRARVFSMAGFQEKYIQERAGRAYAKRH